MQTTNDLTVAHVRDWIAAADLTWPADLLEMLNEFGDDVYADFAFSVYNVDAVPASDVRAAVCEHFAPTPTTC